MGFDWPSERQYAKDSVREAEKLLARARDIASRAGVESNAVHVHDDDVASAVVAAAAKSKSDLIVMASHGRKGLEKLLIGSETQRVLARTKLPVMVVR